MQVLSQPESIKGRKHPRTTIILHLKMILAVSVKRLYNHQQWRYLRVQENFTPCSFCAEPRRVKGWVVSEANDNIMNITLTVACPENVR